VRWQKLYNPMVSWLLRSPLHGLISSSAMLIGYTGRQSGRTYTTPVNYVLDGDTLLVVSPRDRIWWRNLRVASPVTVRVAGRDLRDVGRAFEGGDAVEEGGLLTVLQKAPAFRRYWRVELDPDGQPEHRSRAAPGRSCTSSTSFSRNDICHTTRDPRPGSGKPTSRGPSGAPGRGWTSRRSVWRPKT
jgi:deazaflavin-dependent oxidoreductase (nitroreductase family)